VVLQLKQCHVAPLHLLLMCDLFALVNFFVFCYRNVAINVFLRIADLYIFVLHGVVLH